MTEITYTLRDFLGIDQTGGAAGGRLDRAWEAANMDTRHGCLGSCPGWQAYGPALPGNDAVRTLARFYRRNTVGQREILIAAGDHTLYALLNNAWTTLGTGYARGDWDWVCYEDADEDTGVMTDILLLTNPQDGMVALYGDDLTLHTVSTPAKFAFLARYKERIFGGGAPDYPDSVFYSQPFDPTAWGPVEREGVRLPELSGGRIDVPTWDGDSLTALMPYGSSLLVFKRETVFRLYGADPGEFYLRDQYGADGPISAGTVAVEADAAYLLSRAGLSLYDGSTVRPLCREALHGITASLDVGRLTEACGAIADHTYYVTLPITDGRNLLLALETARGALMAYDGPNPTAMLALEERLVFADGDDPGQLYRMNGAAFEETIPFASRWQSPWCDGGRPQADKSHFRLQGMLETACADGPGRMTVTLETERSRKTRVFSCTGNRLRPLSLRLPCYGRRFRLTLETAPGHRFRFTGPLALTCQLHNGRLF